MIGIIRRCIYHYEQGWCPQQVHFKYYFESESRGSGGVSGDFLSDIRQSEST